MGSIVLLEKLNKDFFNFHYRTKEENFDFFEYTKSASINSYNFPQHFFAIISLFAEDCSHNLYEIRTYNGILCIKGSCKNEGNELMLRCGINGDLVVARVQFIQKRQGNMTKLMTYLKKMKYDYHLKNL